MNSVSAQNHEDGKTVQVRGLMRSRDFALQGVTRNQIKRMVDLEELAQVGVGMYAASDFEATEHHSLAKVCKRNPKGVICLLSALRFHGLTTQSPFQVWLAIDSHAWRPKQAFQPLRIIHMGGNTLVIGVDVHEIEGAQVKVTCPAKTVVDCFKYRNKIGLDVALEALREIKRAKHFNHDELWLFAKQCRVATVMRPYLEALS